LTHTPSLVYAFFYVQNLHGGFLLQRELSVRMVEFKAHFSFIFELLFSILQATKDVCKEKNQFSVVTICVGISESA